MALRKALCNARAHDRNAYRTQRADILRNTGISGGENTNVSNAKAWSLLESAIKLAVLKGRHFLPQDLGIDSRTHHQVMGRLSNFPISNMKNFTPGIS